MPFIPISLPHRAFSRRLNCCQFSLTMFQFMIVLRELQAKQHMPIALPAEWLKNGGGRDVYLPASSHQAAKPLGRYLDPPRLRFSLLSDGYFEHTVTTLGSDAFRVNCVGKNEAAVKSPVTTLGTLAH